MDDLQAHAQRALKQLQQEGFEIRERFAAAGPSEGQARRDHQRAKQLHRTHTFIPVRDMHAPAAGRGLRRTDPLARLDRGLLITAYHRFALRRQLPRMFVEVEHGAGLVDKPRIRRALPGVIPPAFDLVRAQPSANRPRRDMRHDLLLHARAPVSSRFSVSGRETCPPSRPQMASADHSGDAGQHPRGEHGRQLGQHQCGGRYGSCTRRRSAPDAFS